MNYSEAVIYCTKRILPSKIPQTTYNKLRITKSKCKNGIAGVEAVQAMFEYFGIRNKSRYVIGEKSMTLNEAIVNCLNKVSSSYMSNKDYYRFYASKKRFKKGELKIEAITSLFKYFIVKRIDDYREPIKAKQKEYNDFYRKTTNPISKVESKRFYLKDKKSKKYYRFLSHLCIDNGLEYFQIWKALKVHRVLFFSNCEIRKID